MSTGPIGGVLAAVPTPFSAGAEPDFDLFLEHCNWVLDNGCDGLNVLGSTGEATSQSSKVRTEIMRVVAASNLDRGALMVGTGTPSLAETVELTRLAAELGFDAALVVPPYYYAAVSDDGLFEYFVQLIRAVEDTDLGVYLYNFPQMTGLVFSVDLVERLIAAFPNHMRGMKDSSGDLSYTNQMAATFAGSFDVFPGSEAPLPDAVAQSYAGCISASVNATAVQAAGIWRSRHAVNDAEAAELCELRAAIQSVPIAAAAKFLIAQRTGNDSWQRMLPPLTGLSGAQQQSMLDVAARLGFGLAGGKDK